MTVSFYLVRVDNNVLHYFNYLQHPPNQQRPSKPNRVVSIPNIRMNLQPKGDIADGDAHVK